MFGDVVGADVDGRGGRGGDHLDGHGLAVGAGDAVGLAFGCLNDELKVGHVGRDAGHSEGEGLTLAGDGGGAGVLDTDECRGRWPWLRRSLRRRRGGWSPVRRCRGSGGL